MRRLATRLLRVRVEARPANPNGTGRRRILVIETRHLGDVLFATPAIKSLKSAYPASHVAVLIRPGLESLLRDNPSVDEILSYDDDRYASAVERVAEGRFDTACILDRDERMAQFAWQAGIAQRIGYDRPANLRFLTIPVPRADRGTSEIRWSLKLAYAAGGKPVDECPELFGAGDPDRLASWGLRQSDYVVIHPGSDGGVPYKRWPVERFADVASRLAMAGHQIVVTGLPSERDLEKHFLDNHGVRSLIGQTTLKDLIQLVAGCRLLITNDTGPSHIAAALRRPCIAITGFADPRIYHPYPEPHRALYQAIACSPCFGSSFDPQDCPYHSCLKVIHAGEVYREAARALGVPTPAA